MAAMPLVLDNGSHAIKAGLAGEKKPSLTLSSVVAESEKGTAEEKQLGRKKKKKKRYVCGHQALLQQKELDLKLEYPIQRGLVHNMEQTEALWMKCFRNYEVRPQETSLLLGLRPLTPKIDKQKIAQMLFESIGVAGAYVSDHCLLAMYSLGRMNGVVMDIGHETTFATTVLDGQSFVPSTVRCDIGGAHVSRYLAYLLSGKKKSASLGKNAGVVTKSSSPSSSSLTSLLSPQALYTYDKIKEKHCFVADNFSNELKKASIYTASSSHSSSSSSSVSSSSTTRKIALIGGGGGGGGGGGSGATGGGPQQQQQQSFRLPDGRQISVGGSIELCQAPEALFVPSLLKPLGEVGLGGLEEDDGGYGISRLLEMSIQKCPRAVRNELYQSMLVCGGPSMLPGMQRRLQKEMIAVMPQSISSSSSKFRLHLPPHRRHSTFLGGSILASLPLFNQIKMKRSEYAECGPSLVDRKCC